MEQFWISFKETIITKYMVLINNYTIYGKIYKNMIGVLHGHAKSVTSLNNPFLLLLSEPDILGLNRSFTHMQKEMVSTKTPLVSL